MEPLSNLLVYASGDEEGGGSGFQEMVEYSRTNPPVLRANIIGVISNHARGGVWKKANKLGIPFFHMAGPFDAEAYRRIEEENGLSPDSRMFSGWIKHVKGIDPRTAVNIHPGWLSGGGSEPHFGGKKMYGHHVHDAVFAAHRRGEIIQSAVTMHFITESFDQGPIIFRFPVLVRSEDTAETIANRVNQVERAWQSYILNLVVTGKIWLGMEEGFYVIKGVDELREFIPGIELNVRRCRIPE